MLSATAMARLLEKETTWTLVHATRMYFALTSIVSSRLRMMRRNVLLLPEPLRLTYNVASMPRWPRRASQTRNLFAASRISTCPNSFGGRSLLLITLLYFRVFVGVLNLTACLLEGKPGVGNFELVLGTIESLRINLRCVEIRTYCICVSQPVQSPPRSVYVDRLMIIKH